VEYDSADDIIALKSKANGKYLSVKDNGDVIAEADKIGESERFKYQDWDFGSQNLYSLSSKRYIREEEDSITATGERTYGWFVQEWLKCKDYSNPSDNHKAKYYDDSIENAKLLGTADIIIDTWNDNHIVTDDKGRLVTCSNPGMSDGRQFIKETLSEGISRTVRLAKESDVAFIVVGNDPMQVARECYDRPDITLPRHQSDLIRAVYEANPNTVVVVVSSYPYALNWEDKNIPAIVYTSHAGPELGTAIADVLFGRYNPAGRTPMTWYRSVQELPDIMDYDIIKNDMTYLYYKGNPLYPFGYGLSYSKFAYNSLRLEECLQITAEQDNLLMGQGNRIVFRICVEIANISDKDGDEVVQLYFKPVKSRVKRPLRQLCGFKRLYIKAGDRTRIYFDVRECDLEFYDVTREKLCVEEGDYIFMVGPNSRDILLSETVHIRGDIIPARRLEQQTPAILYDDKSGVKMLYSKSLKAHYLATRGMEKHYIKFAEVEINKLQVVKVTAATAAGKACISIHIDSLKDEPAGRIELTITGGPEIFKSFHGNLNPIEGIHDLYLVWEHELSILDVCLS
jgi:beta-glucosidase